MDSNDAAVRAKSWDEYIGQGTMKNRIRTHIHAALLSNPQRPLEHVLLSGPPGNGKSTMAELIAQEINDPLTMIKCPIGKPELLRVLTTFEAGILFLDEIHSLSNACQEMLLPVLGEGCYVINGHQYPIEWMTVIGATTERDQVIDPLLDRFDIQPEYEVYTDDELAQIVSGMALKIELDLLDDDALALGAACGGIPRQAKKFVFAGRALATTTGKPATADEILSFCGTDPDGLSELHRRYLALLESQGGRAGQRTIEGLLRIPGAYARELERLLIEKRYITYTPSGRVLTPMGTARTQGQRAPYVRKVRV